MKDINQTGADSENNALAVSDADDERIYLAKRAQDHRQLAENTRDAGSRSIHSKFAELYAERIRNLDLVQPDQHHAQRY